MAKWKESREPYVKVTESVKSTVLNPTAGEDLIVGAVVISDAGPSTPTLITSQKEFLDIYAGQELTQKYTDSLNSYYTSDPGSNVASTMWLNAYRLAGSTNLLVSRATKQGTGNYVKPLIAKTDNLSNTGLNDEYIVKDTEMLKKVNPFRLTIDKTHTDGWAISINEVGILGNLTDDDGPRYDYFIDNIPDLVDQLNETSRFFSPKYKYYIKNDLDQTVLQVINTEDIDDSNKSDVIAVVFEEVYMASNFLDLSWNSGYSYIMPTPSIKKPEIIGEGSQETSEIPDSYDIYFGEITYEDLDKNNSVYISEQMTDAESFISGIIQNNSTKYTYTTNSSVPYDDDQDSEATIVALFVPMMSDEHEDGLLSVSYSQLNSAESNVVFNSGDETDNQLINETVYEVQIDSKPYYAYFFENNTLNTLGEQIHYAWKILVPFKDNGSTGDNVGDEINFIEENKELWLNKEINLNSKNFSGFEAYPWYATNIYNSSTDLKVRIRRFNHDACSPINTTSPSQSPWKVNSNVIRSYTKDGRTPAESILKKDFYEFAILDPSIDSDWVLFNVGNLSGRGDITIAELNENLGMISLNLPDNLLDLGLNYWESDPLETLDDFIWVEVPADKVANLQSVGDTDSISKLYSMVVTGLNGHMQYDQIVETLLGKIYHVHSEVSGIDAYYQLQYNGGEMILIDKLGVNPKTSSLLNVSDSDILKAYDAISEDERYVVEGICDLGNTYSNIQNYLVNLAVNSNYFYPISCAYSTNYLTITNKAGKIIGDTNKIWFGGQYDIDDATVGYKFNFGTSGLYWETVSRNRRNNNEFAGVFGPNTGIAQLVHVSKDYPKYQRELLLGYKKNINTIYHDLYTERYYWNDNKTGQTEDNVMKEECNTRLQIRISKAMPNLLNQFKGRQNTSKTWAEIESVIDFWFKNVILNYNYTISDFRVLCTSEMANAPELVRANKVKIKIQVRFNNSIKYIDVFNQAYPIGLEFED